MVARRTNARRAAWLLGFGALAPTGCLDTLPAPGVTPQVQVRRPPRLFLADPQAPQGADEACRGLYTGTSTSLADLTPLDPSVAPPSRDDIPFNCFLDVATTVEGQPAAEFLPVDVHEVTNEQMQLCVDSGACRGPDPSKADAADVCRSEGSFQSCPVVDVSPREAQDYCEWVGRRLPSGLEMLVIRQAGIPSADDGFPERLPLLPHTDDIPSTCEDAVLRNGDCDRPFPITADGERLAAAAGDALPIDPDKAEPGATSPTLYDLVGNVAELLADLRPTNRGSADGLPWFCLFPLPPPMGVEYTDADPPTCPVGRACVMGTYRPGPQMDVGVYPVCIAPSQGTITGQFPVLVGASFFEELREGSAGVDDMTVLRARDAAGVFGRRELIGTDADDIASTMLGRRIGFRCVGQRTTPEPFTDRIVPELTP